MVSRSAWSRAAFVAVAPLLLAAAACGGEAPPPVAPPPPPPPAAPAPKLHMSAELGEIDEAATTKTFDRIGPALMRCYTTGLGRLEYMAGDVKFYIRVKPDGRLRWAFLEQSTLGDRKTETCMLGALNDTQWPLPEGGEAEVHHGLGFDAPTNVRPPTDWSPDRVSAVIAPRSADAAACKRHGATTVQVTAYVGANQGAGRVLSAGAAASSSGAAASGPDVAADADCVLGLVRGMKMPSPGSYAAKVSFSL